MTRACVGLLLIGIQFSSDTALIFEMDRIWSRFYRLGRFKRVDCKLGQVDMHMVWVEVT